MKIRISKIIGIGFIALIAMVFASSSAHAQQSNTSQTSSQSAPLTPSQVFPQATTLNLPNTNLSLSSGNTPTASGQNTTNQATGPASTAPATKPALTPPADPAPAGTCTTLIGFSMVDCANSLLSSIVYAVLRFSAYMLGIAGEILNVSMLLTLHIKDFVDATPAIYTVWQTIRDISGLFFIFFLLFAAIQMILGEDEKFSHTITNIVVAGILINFSFFIVSLGIDASNVVSQAIYNQMLPSQSSISIQGSQNGQQASTLTSILQGIDAQGGIANVFMNSLQITKLYDPTLANNGNGGISNTSGLLSTVNIILIGGTGIIMMFTAAMSFIIAAGAFIIRLGILMFILAFSPILFLSWMSPEIKSKAGEITKTLTNQLVFMPLYLLLMYLALSVLNKSSLIGPAALGSNGSLPTGTNWTFPFIVMGVNFTLVIFILNLPLVVAISMSGHMTGAIKKFNAGNIWKNVGMWTKHNTVDRAASSARWVGGKTVDAGKWTAGFAARKTIGVGAAKLDKTLQNTKGIGDTVLGRDILKATTGKLAENKFGTGYSAESYKKATREAAVQGSKIRKDAEFNTALENALGKRPYAKDPSGKDIDVKYTLGKMSKKERLAVVDRLKETHDEDKLKEVAKNLDKETLKAMHEAEETDVSLEQKAKVSRLRKDAFDNALKAGDDKTIKSLMKGMETSDVVDAVGGNLDNPAFLANVTSSHLKEISEKSLLSMADRKKLGNAIYTWEVNPANTKKEVHKAEPYVDKNSKEWLA